MRGHPPSSNSIRWTVTGGIGAVLQSNRILKHFMSHTSHCRLPPLESRRTQIIAYELTASLEAIRRFSNDIANREFILFTDNKSALGMIRKGRSRRDDIQVIIDYLIFVLRANSAKLHPFWIPSALNISDLPSRGKDAPDSIRVRPKTNNARISTAMLILSLS